RSDGLLELRLDVHEHRVGARGAALLHLASEPLDVLAQPSLGDVDRRDVLTPLARIARRAVAQPVEGPRDDVALARNESVGRVAATASSTTAALLLGLSVVLAERTHLEEVDVARADVPRAVARTRVIGDEIARH